VTAVLHLRGRVWTVRGLLWRLLLTARATVLRQEATLHAPATHPLDCWSERTSFSIAA
jgi:hypothetical protein